jgi:hypothetical protein
MKLTMKLTMTPTMKLTLKRSTLSALLALTVFGGLTGCADRTYLTKSHGRAYNDAFARQAVPPEPRKPGKEDPTQGLDSQEAAAVAGSYRRSLAGKEGGGDAQHQMVLMNPGANAQQGGYMPPPSVPGGQ